MKKKLSFLLVVVLFTGIISSSVFANVGPHVHNSNRTVYNVPDETDVGTSSTCYILRLYTLQQCSVCFIEMSRTLTSTTSYKHSTSEFWDGCDGMWDYFHDECRRCSYVTSEKKYR